MKLPAAAIRTQSERPTVTETNDGPSFNPEKAASEAYPLLKQAVGSILKGSEEAREAYVRVGGDPERLPPLLARAD